MTSKSITKRQRNNGRSRDIPLVRALANPDRPQASPIDAFRLARKAWLNGERISIGEIAKELEVSRVTVYRWVGSRERLIEEILWSFTNPLFQDCIINSPGNGVDHIVEVHRRFMMGMADFEPMMRYIRQNPVAAISIQLKGQQYSHGRLISAAAVHMEQQIKNGHLNIPIAAEDMAEMMIMTNGALLYSAIIGDRKTTPAIEQACTIDRMMLMGAFIEGTRSEVKKNTDT